MLRIEIQQQLKENIGKLCYCLTGGFDLENDTGYRFPANSIYGQNDISHYYVQVSSVNNLFLSPTDSGFAGLNISNIKENCFFRET